ncbi:MAG: hypothetical protein IRZ16_18210 [Myxococcaceae bacterium]|nr:hypothetical protein [Myxococcaceae bacterium]
MKRLSLLAACAVFLACGPGANINFKNGFPRAETVKLEFPSKGASALTSNTGTNKDALKGDHSSFYDITRGVTLGVNTGVGFVLGLVKTIADHHPTSTTADTAVWGPYTEDLSPNTWKFTVTAVGQDYNYKLEGKPKTAGDSAYVTVLSGTHTPALDQNGNAIEGFGAGTFTLDWDAAKTLPEHDNNVGKAVVQYSRPDATSDVTITVGFNQVRDDATGNLVDANYTYAKHPGQGGSFEFSTNKNLDEAHSALIEHLTIKSRWNPDGAGRADVKATGGDLTSEATANECWDSNFNSQYMAASWAPNVPELNYGDEATDCAFPTAEYSNL